MANETPLWRPVSASSRRVGVRAAVRAQRGSEGTPSAAAHVSASSRVSRATALVYTCSITTFSAPFLVHVMYEGLQNLGRNGVTIMHGQAGSQSKQSIILQAALSEPGVDRRKVIWALYRSSV